MKHVVTRSLALLLSLVALMLAPFNLAQAGELKSVYQEATAPKYWDWAFAQKVWSEMNTVGKFDAEWAKCSAEFEPWLVRYQKDARRAMDEIDTMPKDKQKKVKRCYDMQLAFDQWRDHVYSPWFNSYPLDASQATIRGKTAASFDDWLAAWAERNTCHQEVMLNECGPVPDWRSPGRKAKEKTMMAEANKGAVEARQKWLKSGK